MKSDPAPIAPPPTPSGSSRVGTMFCLVSAVGYAAVNVCLRALAVESDHAWSICVKEGVAATVVGGWLLIQLVRGRIVWPSRRAILVLVGASLVVQLGGNLAQQWAFRAVGISVATPIVFAMILVAGALLGRFFLAERVTRRSVLALGLVLLGIVALSLSAGDTSEAIAATSPGITTGPLWVALGLVAACVAGVCYGGMTVVLRGLAASHVSVPVVMFVTTGTGVVIMGTLSVWRLGVRELVRTPPSDLGVMLLAGTLNLIAFAAIIQGLKSASVVRASVLNASQVAMCSIAGVVVFAEPLSLALRVGVALTIAGMLLIDATPGKPAPESDGASSTNTMGDEHGESELD